ncbi:ABC transporter ATP-binding protein [Conexibacter woesei]|uniref:Oligopeptide/dipeptide ABC transporter, ATPase subunit n=1 Tax=Conexibacter woesei (strain DSM 14684 / CCUG 47730 / CIP 108061 / JCM 11494 / NBRC 100937 / ID131577) TaxID=469383 RepID=D3F4Z1_CONWI|nr:ABC transporter ATP-binding protein [Conexibacter woesei]ADB48569.1 oligopeptide/dipeptide ABC transporter, ATPase subunit [Conexibacter woesei DSM 14684]
MTDGTLLTVERLDVRFRTAGGWTQVVDGVDLTVGAGETLCVVGESGSGKSVTALALMGLLDAGAARVEGRIDFGGRDLAALSERDWQRVRGNDVAMIFQEPMSSLNPVLRIGDQIAESVLLHSDADKAAADRRAVELLRLVGIPAPERRARDYPHQLSGGMRQRVMIAIALSCSPRLLIADEPTTALDVTIQAQILELIGELRERLEMAVLLITHDLGVVAETADRVAVMYAGKIVEQGDVKAVFEDPQHPYTAALLRAIPVLGSTYAEPLYAIPGTVPSPGGWPDGCRFAARCEHVHAACAQDPPAFARGSHFARCWLRDPDAEERR